MITKQHLTLVWSAPSQAREPEMSPRHYLRRLLAHPLVQVLLSGSNPKASLLAEAEKEGFIERIHIQVCDEDPTYRLTDEGEKAVRNCWSWGLR